MGSVSYLQHIDYWSLEGNEYTVLKRFPFCDYYVSLLTVEHNLILRNSLHCLGSLMVFLLPSCMHLCGSASGTCAL